MRGYTMEDEDRIKELVMKLWFAKNELYSDGSNVGEWLTELKQKLAEVFMSK